MIAIWGDPIRSKSFPRKRESRRVALLAHVQCRKGCPTSRGLQLGQERMTERSQSLDPASAGVTEVSLISRQGSRTPQIEIRPWRMARVTASVRLCAPSLPRNALT